MTTVEGFAALVEFCGTRQAEDDYTCHVAHHEIIETENAWALLRRVNSRAELDYLIDPWNAFEEKDVDCWLVSFLTGDYWEIMAAVDPLPHVGWFRRQVFRVWEFKRLLQHCKV